MSPFHKIPYYPRFDLMTPENAAESLPSIILEARAAVDALERDAAPSWAGLMRPLYDVCQPVYDAWTMLCHMLSVMNSDGWRKAHDKLQPDIVAFDLRVNQSLAFYEGYLAIQEEDRKNPSLSPVRRRILKRVIMNAELTGVGLAPAERSRFNAIQNELAGLAADFRNNLLDATKAFSLLLTEPEQVEGLPQSLLAVTEMSARQEGLAQGRPSGAGPWKITLDTAVYLPFMRHCRNRNVREQLYRAHIARASTAPCDNTALTERIIALRRELASLLGYSSFADLSLSEKCAKKVHAVDELISDLAVASRAAGEREIAALNEFARSSGFGVDGLRPWDIPFWTERQREALYSYSEEELSSYFPFPRVLQGMFSLAENLFGIVIKAADGEAPVWHPDVRFFRVGDRDGAPLACFYLDPYSRPATKSGGAWMNAFRTRDRTPDNRLLLPMAVLVCNQSVPVDGRPPIMRFHEITTLFHEFGHALQHMLTTVEDPQVSGVNGIEWDAVEIASQFMENWCYDRATLRLLSRHVETGATLPDTLFRKLIAAKNHFAANNMLRQLFLAATDMDLYARYPRPEWPDADTVKRCNAAAFLPPGLLLPEDRFLCSFSHIFAGAYAAGYYSYKWSEVYSAEAFAAFEEAGLENETAVSDIGKRFRSTLLALGGGTDPSDVFKMFRNKAPTTDALLRHSGLKQPGLL
ncbi:MAG: M3 family metallopeptidase [Kiritimatiellae bacterium]|nr:M3 family metallopeptidase [Kiritimatiellia bacterium]